MRLYGGLMSKLLNIVVVGSALFLPGAALAQQNTPSCEALVNAVFGPPGQAENTSASEYAHQRNAERKLLCGENEEPPPISETGTPR